MTKRKSLWTAFAMAAALLVPASAPLAQEYPSRLIKIVVPYPPGGGNDVAARLLAPGMQAKLGQTIIVDNRPGAAGQIGTDFVAKAPGDGYTLLLTNPGPQAVAQSLNPALPYDVVKDFTPISVLSRMPFFFVVPANSPYKSLGELLAAEKAKSGAFNFASAGIGSLSHIAGEMLNVRAGTKFVHVPYRGAAPQLQDAIAGVVELSINSAVDAIPHMKSGALRALATTGKTRSPFAPDVPTMAEAGVENMEIDIWYAMLASPNVPPPIVAKLNAVIVEILGQPEIKEKFLGLGSVTAPTTPDELREVIRADAQKYEEIVKKADIKAQ